MNKTEVLVVKGTWQEVINDCRHTVGKEELCKEPSDVFKAKIMLAEHSPIRDISIKWRWKGIKSWIATHWSRHKFECFIRTQREDRTGVHRDDSPQSTPVDFIGEANAQALIDVMKKRLCYQAAAETVAYAIDLKKTIMEVEPEIADVLVPTCVYRCGCPEMTSCGWYDKAVKVNHELASTNIRQRYDAYNSLFYQAK